MRFRYLCARRNSAPAGLRFEARSSRLSPMLDGWSWVRLVPWAGTLEFLGGISEYGYFLSTTTQFLKQFFFFQTTWIQATLFEKLYMRAYFTLLEKEASDHVFAYLHTVCFGDSHFSSELRRFLCASIHIDVGPRHRKPSRCVPSISTRHLMPKCLKRPINLGHFILEVRERLWEEYTPPAPHSGPGGG